MQDIKRKDFLIYNENEIQINKFAINKYIEVFKNERTKSSTKK